MKFFVSGTPATPIYARGGRLIRWITSDGITGVYSTDNPDELKALARCIERKVGGAIREVSPEEFDDVVKKVKGRPRFQPEREYISAEGVNVPQVIPAPQSPDAVAADSANSVPEPESSDTLPSEAPTIRKRGGGRLRKP